MDIPTLYAQARSRVIELVQEADPSQLERVVPATPAWTGRQVLAHVVGITADVVAGRMDGVGTPAWGDRQVAERADASVADLVAEWRSTAAAFDPMLKDAPEGMVGALATDLVQHELDLRASLGASIPDECLSAIDGFLNFMLGFLDRRVKKAGLPALRLRAGNQEWTVGPGDTDVAASVAATPVELFRVVAGRRSAAQVCALDWTGDPQPYLAVLSAFGPLSDADVLEPSLSAG